MEEIPPEICAITTSRINAKIGAVRDPPRRYRALLLRGKLFIKNIFPFDNQIIGPALFGNAGKELLHLVRFATTIVPIQGLVCEGFTRQIERPIRIVDTCILKATRSVGQLPQRLLLEQPSKIRLDLPDVIRGRRPFAEPHPLEGLRRHLPLVLQRKRRVHALEVIRKLSDDVVLIAGIDLVAQSDLIEERQTETS